MFDLQKLLGVANLLTVAERYGRKFTRCETWRGPNVEPQGRLLRVGVCDE